MSLDETLPSDINTTLAEYAALLRETRAEVNDLISAVALLGGSVSVGTTLNLDTGTTQIVVGTDISDVAMETISLTATAAVVIDEICGGRAGQVKFFVFGDGNVTFTNNAAKINLNRVGDYISTSGDVVGLINIGGDPTTSENGYWKEFLSTLAI